MKTDKKETNTAAHSAPATVASAMSDSVSDRPLTVTDIPCLRLLAQQLVSPRFSDPRDVVEWMGMVQAQDYRAMRWAVAMRMRQPSASAFHRAYDEGRIVRVHLFRCTWQLVAAEDLHWMLALCADRNRRTLNSYLAANGRTATEQDYARFNRMLEEILHDRDSMRKGELAAALSARGFAADDYMLSVHLRRAEIDGIICSGRLDARQSTYALVASRIPSVATTAATTSTISSISAASQSDCDEAMSLLAHKYFRSHSPATLRDFVWWTGLPVAQCRRAIAAISKELTEHTIEGDIYYLHRDISDAATAPDNLSSTLPTHLLPPYDEYLIGYKTRHHVLEDAFRARAFSNNGIFRPVIVSQGRVVGNWHPRTDCPDFFRPEYRTDTSEARVAYSLFAEL